MISSHALLIALWAIVGYGCLLPLRNTLSQCMRYASAFPVGCGIYALAATVMMVCYTIISPWLITAGLLLIGTTIIVLDGLARVEWRQVLGLFLAYYAAALACEHSALVAVSFDSVTQIIEGRSLNEPQFLSDRIAVLATWGVLLLQLHGAANVLNTDYLVALSPLLGVSVAGMLWAIVRAQLSRAWAWLAVTMLMSCSFILFQFAYIHNSLLSSAYMLLMFGCLQARERCGERDARWLMWTASLSALCFALTRLEAPLYMGVGLVFCLAWIPLSSRERSALVVPYVVGVIAWFTYLTLYLDTNTPDALIKPIYMLGMMLGTALIAAMAYAQRWQRCATLATFLPIALTLLCALLVGIAVLWQPSTMIPSIGAVVHNLFYTGMWGSSWWWWLPLLALLPLPASHVWRTAWWYSVAFFFLILLLGALRTPYRIGFGDSANRIIIILVPVLMVALCMMLAQVRERAGQLPNTTRYVWPLALAVFSACAAFAIMQPPPPVNYASSAIVVESGTYCPCNTHGCYGFDVALRPQPGVANNYSAACDQKPRIIVLDFTRAILPSRIELHYYTPADVFTDFAIEASPDMKHWQVIYDTTHATGQNRLQRLPNGDHVVQMQAKTPMRFMRLTYRASGGQGRLLLRGLEVY